MGEPEKKYFGDSYLEEMDSEVRCISEGSDKRSMVVERSQDEVLPIGTLPPVSGVRNIMEEDQIGEYSFSILERVRNAFPDKIEWWLSEDPLVRVWGVLSSDLKVLSEYQHLKDVIEIFSDGLKDKDRVTIFFAISNREVRKIYLKSCFPDVNFDGLLNKPIKGIPENDDK